MRSWTSVVGLLGFLAASAAGAAPVEFSGNGHYYELIYQQGTWLAAKLDAESRTFNGIPGHLVTITSVSENDFLDQTFNNGLPAQFAWIAGYEPLDDGDWFWSSGPEDGIQFAMSSNATPPFYYAGWGGIEPNDFNPGEDYAAINIGLTFADVTRGAWIDSPNPNPSDPIVGFIVEYSPLAVPALSTPSRIGLISLLLVVALAIPRGRLRRAAS